MRGIGVLILCAILGFVELSADDENVGLKTDTGAPLKIVARHDTAMYERPDRSSSSRPVKMFSFFYVHRTTKGKLVDDFYHVASGPSKAAALGWIHKNDVVEWPHRQALGLRPLAGRELVEFFETKPELTQAFSGGTVPTPLSREPKAGGGINLMPILNVFELTEAEGDTVAGYRVAYLHSAGGAHGGSVEGGRFDPRKASLDIVFVVDSTGSMGSYIEATKTVISKVAKRLSVGGEANRVRFGLVAYRDAGDAYVARTFCQLAKGRSHATFQASLDEVNASGGGDYPEDVFAGLKMAIRDIDWNPDGFKQIVLMGDAPAHTEMSGSSNRERLTIEGVIALAQPRGSDQVKEQKVIHAVRIKHGEDEDFERQFRQLAKGEAYHGEYREFDKRDIDGLVNELTAIILKSSSGLSKAIKGVAPASDTPGLGLLMEMVRHTDTPTGVKQFASGFACEIDAKGNQAMEPYVLVRREQLEMFDSLLDFSVKQLKNAGEPGAKDVKKIVTNIQKWAAGLNMDEDIDPDTPLVKILNLILGFPVKNKIFDITFARLAAMTEADFQSWIKQVESSRSIIHSHLDNPRIWKSLGDVKRVGDQVCFLKVKDLP